MIDKSVQHIDYKKICGKYFQLFSDKDIVGLSCLLSDEVKLLDWKGKILGKKSVLAAYNNIFNGVEDIQINILFIYSDSNTVIAELDIIFNSKEKISVCDIITIDCNQMVASIRAYKK